MKLSHLIADVPVLGIAGDPGVQITGLTDDSRQVEPGDLFVAVPGLQHDGHAYIPQALRRGAAAVVIQREAPGIEGMPYVLVANCRQALALLAAAFYGHPGRQLTVMGVTGTEGKTTTTHLIAAVLEAAGRKVGLISTLGAKVGEAWRQTGLHTTTPGPLEVQAYLAEMMAAGCRDAVLETTSHALDQERTLGCEYDLALVTNVTHDHLDYHLTYEAYRATKGKLLLALHSFRKPHTPKVAILNADDEAFDYLRALPADRYLSYGMERPAEVRAADLRLWAQGLAFRALTPQGEFVVQSPLLGRANAYNALAAVAVGISQGLPAEAIARGIAGFRAVTGRLERIEGRQDFTILVDFAHTPNALRRALEAVRPLTGGRVIVVFGCPGLRDRAKRPMMGEIAARLADYTVITADDPRTEDLGVIIDEIASGCQRAGAREGIDYWRIPDRAQALDFALGLARSGDLVLAAGKGHEQSLAIGEEEIPWSEHEVIRIALARQGLGAGSP